MDDIIREIPIDNGLSDKEIKDLRKQEWRNNIEAEMQPLILQAIQIQKNINDSKTNVKKVHFTKKFNKIKLKIRHYVNLLNALGPEAVEETHENMLAFTEEQEKLQGDEYVNIPTT